MILTVAVAWTAGVERVVEAVGGGAAAAARRARTSMVQV